MFALPAVSGYAAVFVCGSYPGFILKTSHSIAKFHRLVGPSVRSICPFNVTSGEGRFLYYDSTVLLPFSAMLRLGDNTNLRITIGI